MPPLLLPLLLLLLLPPPHARALFDSQRSFTVMLVIVGFAMTDRLTLKEGVTVVAPDHKPLLALVSLFGKRVSVFVSKEACARLTVVRERKDFL